jgi:hypothetical protein
MKRADREEAGVRRRRKRKLVKVAAVAILLVLLPLRAAGPACMAQDGVTRGADPETPGAKCLVEAGGIVVTFAVGAEPVTELRVEAASAAGMELVRNIARETGRMLVDWIDDDCDGDPRLKGSQDADSRRSP